MITDVFRLKTTKSNKATDRNETFTGEVWLTLEIKSGLTRFCLWSSVSWIKNYAVLVLIMHIEQIRRKLKLERNPVFTPSSSLDRQLDTKPDQEDGKQENKAGRQKDIATH